MDCMRKGMTLEEAVKANMAMLQVFIHSSSKAEKQKRKPVQEQRKPAREWRVGKRIAKSFGNAGRDKTKSKGGKGKGKGKGGRKEPCRRWNSAAGCPDGDECKYGHGQKFCTFYKPSGGGCKIPNCKGAASHK